jgi:hypothetical protein
MALFQLINQGSKTAICAVFCGSSMLLQSTFGKKPLCDTITEGLLNLPKQFLQD